MFFFLRNSRAIKIFFVHSNSRDDEKLRVKLETHLSSLQLPKESIKWHSSQTPAGRDWKKESYQHINTVQVIVLLVSPDFIKMDDCRNMTKRAMERHNTGKARVIPVKLRRIDNWQAQPFGNLQYLPRNGEHVTSRFWPRQDDAFVDIVENIRAEIEKLEEEQRQQQLIRKQQKDAKIATIQNFISNQSFERKIIAASMIAFVVVALVVFFSRPSSERQVENLLTQAQNKYDKGEYQGATEDYTKAIDIAPNNVEAYIGRGNAHAYLKNYKAAMNDYTQVIRLAKEEADAYMNRAVVRCALGDKQGTIQDYQKAASLYGKQGATNERKQALDRLQNLQQCLPHSSKERILICISVIALFL
ncbi:MAG: hypothetical protein C6Y22_08655 [Hapalosiphonaceae cyanobacterium JJU2]|nr:MAG: hypothetical protein C6Y22_08655 [Hapalosiphonaceae cyanobacterium JJU2]